MIKNVIIGVLALLSLFFFFYGWEQQVKAENLMKVLIKAQKEAIMMESLLEQARLNAKKYEQQLKATRQLAKEGG
ncbi:MAG: hypothetical protein AABY93_04215 [Bacteroidota bacterium]